MASNSTLGMKVKVNEAAAMWPSRLASLTSRKRRRATRCCANAWITPIPEIASARLPTSPATRSRVMRKARRARSENTQVASSISGATANVTRASCRSKLSIATTMPASSRVSPAIATRPCDSASLITATSPITCEMVTPTMCRSW